MSIHERCGHPHEVGEVCRYPVEEDCPYCGGECPSGAGDALHECEHCEDGLAVEECGCEVCERCEGNGWLSETKTCPDCDGLG